MFEAYTGKLSRMNAYVTCSRDTVNLIMVTIPLLRGDGESLLDDTLRCHRYKPSKDKPISLEERHFSGQQQTYRHGMFANVGLQLGAVGIGIVGLEGSDEFLHDVSFVAGFVAAMG